MVRTSFTIALLVLAPFAGSESRAQDNNLCDMAGEQPDVVVGDIGAPIPWGNVGDIYGYSLATLACNVGTCRLNWVGNTANHPVIAQNLYRLKDRRFSQIGQSWLKHAFAAFQQGWCSSSCLPADRDHLGVNCSDPYAAGLNAFQEGLGPRYEVDPSTGEFPYPFTGNGVSGNEIYKRLQVHVDDLTPALNVGARYFAEGHYVARDDAAGGNQNNNASYREVVLDPANYAFQPAGATQRERAGLQAWRDVDPGVSEAAIDVPGDGRLLVAAQATSLGGGLYHYEYAVHNLNSYRAATSFSVPIAAGAIVSGLGFHDVDPHSGDVFDGADWTAEHDVTGRRVFWMNPEANPLRWGTLYNFWFDADVAPQPGRVELGLFHPPKPGAPPVGTVSGASIIPDSCSHDGSCQSPVEDCVECSFDCAGPLSCCGEGGCELGENACACPADCGAPPAHESDCANGLDDDCDGKPDCQDPDCCAATACRDEVDNDGDGVAVCDCNDIDPSVWATPGEVTGLVLVRDVELGVTRLVWSPPAATGGTMMSYETLRSVEAADWIGAVCVHDAMPFDTTNVDGATPALDGLFLYLVRGENRCPDGVGPIGEPGETQLARRCP